ncbi:Rrf2 family transcriptional regulator [Psychrobacillus sp. NEAU-3TGS]|uniref:RrF2 family transcriptional regulator n=1 Tax=Psychrobacillus sp. NEAU-3TGS TaxID=2995412 RepID=UPI0024995AD7|nr:Rrf2 family transcriptional regulator [Psychrobacillus sp. NEAU-3TGS]MDI2588602.1 Rrf2 family transcriptional regulator [Psychrobacillus sp. NEAU-3TGS]
MKYSVMVEYALHSLVYLIDVPSDESIGIKDLSEFQGLSETYLSKVFGKLSKAGIVSSIPGVNGGYKLARAPEEISFWDVIRAVEGIKPIFQCQNILKNSLMYVDKEKCSSCTSGNSACTINLVMLEAEQQMYAFLSSKTISWLDKELEQVLPKEIRVGSREYFKRNDSI